LKKEYDLTGRIGLLLFKPRLVKGQSRRTQGSTKLQTFHNVEWEGGGHTQK
jgi:hypothetical protein